MGSLTLAALLPPPPSAVDDAQEIGAVPVCATVGAMRVGYAEPEDETLRFLGESPLYLATAWRMVDDSSGHRHRWWRLEGKIATKNDGIARGDELVVAEHPYGNGWLHHAPFKSGSKKGAVDRPVPPETALVSADTLIAWVETLSYDYWDKGNYLTAGVSEPQLPFSLGGSVRNVQRQALYVFGSSSDFAGQETALLQSPQVQTFLRATELGIIRFWAPKAKIKGRPTLFDEVKSEALELMIVAIRQALAGPHRYSERWVGRPVVEKVSQIYRGHLNLRNRQVAKAQGRLVEYDDALAHGSGGTGWEELLDLTDEWDEEAF